MEETGRVTRTDGDRATVEVVPGDACRTCGASGMCNWTGKAVKTLVVVNRCGARAGDTVRIRTDEARRAVSSLFVFGLPVALMAAGVAVGVLFLTQAWAVGLAFAGLGVALAVLKLADRAAARAGRNLPVAAELIAVPGERGEAGPECRSQP